jgi:hypothetical protein
MSNEIKLNASCCGKPVSAHGITNYHGTIVIECLHCHVILLHIDVQVEQCDCGEVYLS